MLFTVDKRLVCTYSQKPMYFIYCFYELTIQKLAQLSDLS